MAMKRSHSEPRSNPFWSERATNELRLAQLRPQALPETPSAVLPPVPPDQPNEWEERTEGESPRPVNDQQKGSLEKRSGRGSVSSSTFKTPRSWQWQDNGWVPRSQGVMPKDEVIRSEGPIEKCGPREERALEEALEKEMVEQLLRENAALRQQMLEMQASKTGSSWSEVTPGEPEATTPRRGGQPNLEKKGEGSKFTPGGTRVPNGLPPDMADEEMDGWAPAPPPLPPIPSFPEFEAYEKLELGKGNGRMQFGSTPWIPRFPSTSDQSMTAKDIWLAVEELNARSEALRQLCLGEGKGQHDRALHGSARPELLQQDRALHGSARPELPQQDRALHGSARPELLQQDRALHSSARSGLLQQGRAVHGGAWQELPHQDRASALYGELLHEDRAFPEHGEDCHRDRASMWQDLFPGKGRGQGPSHGLSEGLDRNGAVMAQNTGHDSQGGGTRVELPPLPTNLNPMDLGDWLTLIGPVLRDISAQSSKWWELTVKQANVFYDLWRTSSPVQRVKIQPCLPEELNNPMYARTEQRGMGLLLRAVSEDIRRILMSNRDMNSTSLVWRLLITFQPGGPGEKGQLLEDLTVLKSSSTASEVATSLRTLEEVLPKSAGDWHELARWNFAAEGVGRTLKNDFTA